MKTKFRTLAILVFAFMSLSACSEPEKKPITPPEEVHKTAGEDVSRQQESAGHQEKSDFLEETEVSLLQGEDDSKQNVVDDLAQNSGSLNSSVADHIAEGQDEYKQDPANKAENVDVVVEATKDTALLEAELMNKVDNVPSDAAEDFTSAALNEPEADQPMSDDVPTSEEKSPERPTISITATEDCRQLPEKIKTCSGIKCMYQNPLLEEEMQMEIRGVVSGKCLFVQDVPMFGEMKCRFDEDQMAKAGEYFEATLYAESYSTEAEYNSETGGTDAKHVADGEQIENPFEIYMMDETCTITGDDIPGTQDKCPPGTEYKGEMYSYENDEKVAHPICSDPNTTCPPCENCKSGSSKEVSTITYEMVESQDGTDEKTTAALVCKECTRNSECKEGFHCFDDSCISNDVLANNPSCDDSDRYSSGDPCQKYSCETCEKGQMHCQSGWSDWPADMKYKCVECNDAFTECAEGYKCEEYKCVVEQ